MTDIFDQTNNKILSQRPEVDAGDILKPFGSKMITKK